MQIIYVKEKLKIVKKKKFTAGAYNMGGSPAPTVAKIKNMVYMNHTGEEESQPREEYLGKYILIY